MIRVFQLTTRCAFKTSASAVWEETVNVAEYPQWCPPVKRIVLHGSDSQLLNESFFTCRIKGFLPWTIEFGAQVTACIPGVRLEVIISGDLLGNGVYVLEEANGETLVHFQWNVDLAIPLLYRLSRLPPVHALFAANHRYVTLKAIKKMKLRVEHVSN